MEGNVIISIGHSRLPQQSDFFSGPLPKDKGCEVKTKLNKKQTDVRNEKMTVRSFACIGNCKCFVNLSQFILPSCQFAYAFFSSSTSMISQAMDAKSKVARTYFPKTA